MLVSETVGKSDRVATKHSFIYELIDDGLESYISPNNSINGFIFFIRCVYYRSSWKYQNRGVRYCFLDSGHHLGVIAASAYVRDRNVQLIFDFDKLALNLYLGFENKEFIIACAISGEFQAKKVRRLRLKVPFICGTDYFEASKFIEAFSVVFCRKWKKQYQQKSNYQTAM